MKYFNLSEFNCKHCGKNKMDQAFLLEVDELRSRYGKPLVVVSGYRCSFHNSKVSSTGLTGPHTTGRAVDLAVDRGDAVRLLKIALEMQFTGVGVQQKGAGRFIHLDNLPNAPGQPRPSIWSY